MLIVWEHKAGEVIAATQYSRLYQYPHFDLVDYDGDLAALEGLRYEVTEQAPVFVNGHAVSIARDTFDASGHPRTILRFAGPIAQHWLRTLKALRVNIRFNCPPYGICVELPDTKTLSQLRERVPALVGAVPYTEKYCYRLDSRLSTQFAAQAGQLENWFDLVCFSETDRENVIRQFEQDGINVLAKSKYKLRIEYNDSTRYLRELNGVKLIDQTRISIPASTTTELGTAMGVDAEPTVNMPLLDGQGQIVAVADTGLDRGAASTSRHPDFGDRVRDIQSWPINESWAMYVTEPGHDDGGADVNSGHGTHVAGLALGDGQASAGKYAGLAPGASLVFQAMEQYTTIKPAYQQYLATGYYLSGRPVDIRNLFSEARESGARIHVNAWGNPARGAYTDDCYEADDFLFKHPDAVILFAAGNDGADRDGNRRIDEKSLYAPASGKNVIAIGATEGPRSGVGIRSGWGIFNSRQDRRFRHSADQSDNVSGEPEHIAMISSAGPTIDGRIKPDVCAPGTNLPAARSLASQSKGWGLASPYPYYMYNGGTSMATGAAGGYFALLRQSWSRYLGSAPSGPALKALAILGAQPVYRRDSERPEPATIAGFGRLNLHTSQAHAGIRLYDEQSSGLFTGEQRNYRFRLNQARSFRAVLCWYDPPGEVLINDLDMYLENEQGEILFWGNHEQNRDNGPDRKNTVEVINAPLLEAGTYTLSVVAANVPRASQTYAVVCDVAAENLFRINLPLPWLKGIGKRYSQRLESAGLSNINALLDCSLTALEQALSRSGTPVEKVYSRLRILEERLEYALPLSVPPGITLSQLGMACPEGIDASVWQAVTAKLLPVKGVFDKRRLSQISLGDLYDLQDEVT